MSGPAHTTMPPPAPHAHRDAETLAATWSRPAGLLGWITTTNHKDIGLRFVVTAFVFFTLAGVLALLMRTQLLVPENGLLGPDLYNQLFTTHGTAMMFLFAVPVMEGMGLYFVPLMIGARNVAFPRLLNFAYWMYLFAGLLLFAGLFTNTGPDQGWFSYVPLAGPDYTPGKRADVWSQVITLVEIASLAGAVEIIATVFKLRTVGMGLARIPLFVWAQLVTSVMVLFAMPAVMLVSTLLSMDRLTNVSTHFFNPAEGGDALLWQHLFWFFAHPEVYIIFLPATGFVSSILPVFARRKIFGYTALVLSLIATAFIGFGVWVHHMFTTPIPELGQGLFTAASLMIVVPNGVQIFCWLATLWGGKLHLRTPMLFVLGFIAVFVVGGLTGVMLASVALDLQVHDTFFVVAHLHYVLIGGAVFPLLGAICFWYPKWTGRMLDETAGRWSFWLLFVGFNLTFWPMHHLGLRGMPRRVYTYLPETEWQWLNVLATIGAYVIAAALLVFAGNLLWSRRHGMRAGADPWGAGELEWSTTSPPPRWNFTRLPTVQGRYPVWENAGDAPVVTGLSSDTRQLLTTTVLDATPDHRYDVGGESLWPFFLAVAAAFTFIVGGMFHPIGVPIGAALVTVALMGWFWTSDEYRHHPDRLARRHGAAPAPVVPADGHGHRPRLDVADLPTMGFDARSPLWWGNGMLILIETVTLALLLVAYFYLRRNFAEWPPPKVDVFPPVYGVMPALWPGTLNAVLLVAGSALMYWVDVHARRKHDRQVRLGLGMAMGAGLVSIVLRLFEFQAVGYRWDENAYASVVWAILGLHLTYIVGGTLEILVMWVHSLTHHLDDKHALDVTTAGGYWYWLTGTWLVAYAVIHFAPRLA